MRTAVRGACVATLVAAGGCRSAARSRAPSPGYASVVTGVSGHALGDSAAFGAAIVGVDAAAGGATIRLARSAYVKAIGVTPGVSVEILVDGLRRSDRGIVQTGTHATSIGRPDGQALPDQPWIGSPEYDRCVAAGIRQYYREPYVPPRTERDAQGRTVTSPPSPSEVGMARADARAKAESIAERSCRTRASGAAASGPRPTVPYGGDYLLLLVTDQPIDDRALDTRLAHLSLTATDADETMSAVLDGLLVGRRMRWSGYYVPWKPRPSP